METTCAECRLSDGLIINIIVASPSDPAPDGCQLVEIMTGQACDIGWYYANSVFNGPRLYAMCDSTTNAVVSFFSASFVSPVPAAPTGYFGVEVTSGSYANIGWIWDGAKFNPPAA